MIVDFHTHIFPPDVTERRERHVREDPTFRVLYADPKAKLATAEDLLRSMDEAGIDVSVALGFAWSDPAVALRHNEYLASVAGESAGRIVPFFSAPVPSQGPKTTADVRWVEPTVPLTPFLGGRENMGGAHGFGELRPENLGMDLDAGQGAMLAGVASRAGVPLLFHVSEPVGHPYAGKEGLDVGAFYRFVAAHPSVTVIGAHWAGGLPFYAAMPEVRALFEGNLYVDTAASSLLYDDGIYERVAGLIGAKRILFGSDFPLLGQEHSRRRIEKSGLDEASKSLILGENAMRLLKLT